VWSWLLGPFITALVRLHGTDGRRRGQTILEGFEPHLEQAGLGSVSEIFDGDRPHAPRGCVAQAWSVGELLRAYCEDVLGHHPSGDVAQPAVGTARFPEST
jgi:glycogen debranching enzyme